MKSTLFYLITKHGYNPAVKRAVKKIIDGLSIALLVLLCIIDWDAVLTSCGL